MLFYYVCLRPGFRVVMSVTISVLKQCPVRVCIMALVLYTYLCLLAHSGV